MTNKKVSIDLMKILVLIIIPVFVVSLATSQVSLHAGVPYELDQINVHLGNALKTNNPDAKLNYLISTYTALEPYSGNPEWIFPTERTDMSVTKQLLQSAIEKTTFELKTTEKEQWMVLPHNEFDTFLEENVKDIQSRIVMYKKAYGGNPEYNPVFWFWFFTMPLTLAVFGIVEWKVNGKRNTGYYLDNVSRSDVDFWHRY